ncbi:hypoxanthine phosphoribosyltransferase [Arcanobacterium wilhelmae]|uniref:Hypoxanthine phosphoribosyltransferase n=1 Tax=Arcanobacterium wilhelmae TaxID=1803177 RepID=A0ABT9NA15_9ACTO|nr:phosphoribosyltransferase [Arcanobacterium wilhelmae]MDP9800533.1 hypoxanthine phosphoribosyltransferase [Arcanobacterium wilhelmae]WFN89949.1 phosphoribosyltransferase [Arcanobacterium wilhelmae]
MEKEILSWEMFGDATRELATNVWESGYRPDLIVCVARGGLIPAGAMAYALDMKPVLVMNVEFYTKIGETLPDPRLLNPLPDFSALKGAKVLIVDDVVDSGRTLKYVQELCEANEVGEMRLAVIYEKPTSVLKADYVWRDTDLWISFPWSEKDPVNAGEDYVKVD